MKTLVEQLANYASYHRSRRNIATHLVGIPLIVLAVMVLLSRPALTLGGWPISVASVAAALSLLYYLRLDLRFGLIMTALFIPGLWFGAWAASLATPWWLALGAGGFLLGWVIQFIGHYFEGRKPAFFDDVVGLLIGPLFVVAELLFAAGALREMKAQVEQRAGPLRA